LDLGLDDEDDEDVEKEKEDSPRVVELD